VPADQRPPRGPARPPLTRRAADPLAAQRRRIERIWALALRRFRDYLHGTERDSSTDSVENNTDRDATKDNDDRS
jgi:hypothetical protein